MALIRRGPRSRLGTLTPYPSPRKERMILSGLGSGDVAKPAKAAKVKGGTTCKAPRGQEVVCASNLAKFDSLLVDVCLVRAKPVEAQLAPSLAQPEQAAEVFLKHLRETKNLAREVFLCGYLDTRHRLVGIRSSEGGQAEAMVDPGDIVRAAVLLGSRVVIFAHNHPSGDTVPSEDDFNLTRELIRHFGAVKIGVLDSVIVGPITDVKKIATWYSMRSSARNKIGGFYGQDRGW